MPSKCIFEHAQSNLHIAFSHLRSTARLLKHILRFLGSFCSCLFLAEISMPQFGMAQIVSLHPTLSTEELSQSNCSVDTVAASLWGRFLCPRAWVKTARLFAWAAVSHGGRFGYCWPKIELVTWGKNKKENKSLCIALPYPRGIKAVRLSQSLVSQGNLASNSKMLSPEMFW